jgi:hypothetical protein
VEERGIVSAMVSGFGTRSNGAWNRLPPANHDKFLSAGLAKVILSFSIKKLLVPTCNSA